MLGPVPAPRGWALAAHTLPVHVLRSALPRAGGWGWNSSGKVPFLVLTAILFLDLLCSAPWVDPAAGLGGVTGYLSSFDKDRN